jgi:hypothetical protein
MSDTCFAILSDGTGDIGHKQMTVILRYVDMDKRWTDMQSVGYITVEETTVVALEETILTSRLSRPRYNWLRCQGYDNGANMIGAP